MDDGSSDPVFQGQNPGQIANFDVTYALIRLSSNALSGRADRVRGYTIEPHRTRAHELDALRCEALLEQTGKSSRPQ